MAVRNGTESGTNLEVIADNGREYSLHSFIVEWCHSDHIEMPEETWGDRIAPPSRRPHGSQELHVNQPNSRSVF